MTVGFTTIRLRRWPRWGTAGTSARRRDGTKKLITDVICVRFAEATCSQIYCSTTSGGTLYSIRYSVKMALSVLKTILRYLGLDRDLRSAWVQPLAGRKRFIEIDLRKNNGQIYDIAARMPATDPVGTDRQMSSESVRPS